MLLKLAAPILFAVWTGVPVADARKKREGESIFDTVQSPTQAQVPSAAGEMFISTKNTYVDSLCADYCDDYFNKWCTTSNVYLNGGSKRKRRNLITTQEEDLDRGSSWSSALEKCHATCMLWPRGVNPGSFNIDERMLLEANEGKTKEEVINETVNSNLGSDTFWCRKTHMMFAELYGLNSQVFHCAHMTNSASGICRDSLIDDYTPYELLRDGQPSRHHIGYCDIAADETVVDCTGNMGINQSNLYNVLAMMPKTTKVIFLNGIAGITALTANIFSDHLLKPSNIQAIYVNDCKIDNIDASALNGLPNLKIFNADYNHGITSISGSLFSQNPKLLQFSMTATAISSLPANLFSNTKDIERIVIFQSPGIISLPSGLFDGLKNLNTILMVDNGITNGGIPNDLFDDLESLEYWHFFGNQLTTLKKRWFTSGGQSKLGKSLLDISLWNNGGLTTAGIEDGVFDKLDKLEVVFLHGTQVDYINPEEFADKKNFNHLTLG